MRILICERPKSRVPGDGYFCAIPGSFAKALEEASAHYDKIGSYLKDFRAAGLPGDGVDATALSIQQAGLLLPGLHLLEKRSGMAALNPISAEVFTQTPLASTMELAEILNAQGSDKAKISTGYHQVYYQIFQFLGRDQELRILEVGMGTNNTQITSNMGNDGTPGASLRAWRQYLPHSHIMGADFDSGIMFKEDRIDTHVVDQLDFASFERLYEAFGSMPFDVIIDDALHSNVANLNTIAFGLNGACTKNGWIVVEDIGRDRIDFFSIIIHNSLHSKVRKLRYIGPQEFGRGI